MSLYYLVKLQTLKGFLRNNFHFKIFRENMALLGEGVKQRLSMVIEAGKFVFHVGFIPTVLYLGFKKGADPGMPEITLSSLLW